MKNLKPLVAFAVALTVLAPSSLFASSHREAPITALDRGADVTDWYAFVSYDHPDRVTMILNADGFLEPSNGPNYFPFDPNVLYEMKVDNNRDGADDIVFQFRFTTENRLPGVFTGFVGGIAGIPQITALSGPGSEGLGLRQSYTVTMVKNGVATDLTGGRTLYAVPVRMGTWVPSTATSTGRTMICRFVNTGSARERLPQIIKVEEHSANGNQEFLADITVGDPPQGTSSVVEADF
jgi:hypothetical protein